MSEPIKLAFEILAKYGYTEQHNNYEVRIPFEYVTCRANVYQCYDNTVDVSFNGRSYTYNLNRKKDIARLKTRAREVAKRYKADEAVRVKDEEEYIEKYKDIHEALVERQVVFGMNIFRRHDAAVFKVNGHNLTVRNTECKVAIRIAGSSVTVPIEKAIEIANLLPREEINAEDY